MKNLGFWFRPTLFLFAWLLAVAFTLAELARMPPLLTALGAEPAGLRERPLRARTQIVSRQVLAP